MPRNVIMPKFGMDQETGTVVAWLKQEGDPVEKGEALLEVETDKVNMEVEAPASGVLADIRAKAGTTVPIGETIALLLAPGEALPDTATDPSSKERAEEGFLPPPNLPQTGRETKFASTPPASHTEVRKLTPVAARMVAAHAVDGRTIPSAGERITKADVAQHLVTQQPAPSSGIETGKVRAVPAARRLARELGVDLATVTGSGPHGRIQSRDVQATPIQNQKSQIQKQKSPVANRKSLTATRRTIAQRLSASVREIPQFPLSMDVNMRRSQEVLADLRSVNVGPRVTMTALLVKACARALVRHPHVNASFGTDEILEWVDINVGVAMATAKGLVVPVIHRADTLDVATIAVRLAALGEAAQAGTLQAADVQGGTFSLSNLGMFGVDRFTAIINPPQAAILAVGQTVKRPVVVEEEDVIEQEGAANNGTEQLVIQPLCTFTLTADHRVLDGVAAAEFLGTLKQLLERPGLLV